VSGRKYVVVLLLALLLANSPTLGSSQATAETFDETLLPHEYFALPWVLDVREGFNYSILIQDTFGEEATVFVCDSDSFEVWAQNVGTIPSDAHLTRVIASLEVHSNQFFAPRTDIWFLVIYNHMGLGSVHVTGQSYFIEEQPFPPLDIVPVVLIIIAAFIVGSLIVITATYLRRNMSKIKPRFPESSGRQAERKAKETVDKLLEYGDQKETHEESERAQDQSGEVFRGYCKTCKKTQIFSKDETESAADGVFVVKCKECGTVNVGIL